MCIRDSISFGLPCRPYLNTTFLTMAMYAGLDLAIMNPSSEEMMAAVYAYNVLTNRDRQSTKYIERLLIWLCKQIISAAIW